MKWPVEPLVNVCQIMMGQAPAGTSYNDAEKGVPLVAGAGDFNGTVPKVHKYTTAPSKVSNVGDIILGIRASIGEKVWSDQPYCLGRGVAGLRVKSNLSPWFLWHWLGFAKKELLSKARGATFLQVNRKDIESLQIPLPPLEEQRRIAKILDAADELRAKRRESLALLDSLIQSTFLDMFGDPVTNPMGWEVRRLDDIGNIQTGSTPPFKLKDMFCGPIPFITPGDLKETWVDSSRTLTEAGAAKSRTVHKGATFVCCIGTIGKMGKAKQLSAFNQQINAISWGNEVVDDFGFEMLKFYKSEIIKDGASTTLPILKKSRFQKICVPIPPLPLQQRFASIVESIEKQKTRLKAHLSEVDTLFASLQSRAFQGEL